MVLAPAVMGPPESAQQAGPKPSQHGNHVVEVPQPSVYSIYSDDAYSRSPSAARDSRAPNLRHVNLRASWLTGHAPVYGDAVVTLVRVSYLPDGRQAVRWRDYGQLDLWRSLTARFPHCEYTRCHHAPLVARLPVEYRSILLCLKIQSLYNKACGCCTCQRQHERWESICTVCGSMKSPRTLLRLLNRTGTAAAITTVFLHLLC